MEAGAGEKNTTKYEVVDIPVCYGGDYGPDLDEVAQQNHLTPGMSFVFIPGRITWYTPLDSRPASLCWRYSGADCDTEETDSPVIFRLDP